MGWALTEDSGIQRGVWEAEPCPAATALPTAAGAAFTPSRELAACSLTAALIDTAPNQAALFYAFPKALGQICGAAGSHAAPSQNAYAWGK